MSLFNVFRGQFIDIIEWLEDDPDTMAYRFERHENEIKNGGKRTARPGQEAVFTSDGTVADQFPPGAYTPATNSLRRLATLQGWNYGFESPLKAEVDPYRTEFLTNRKWSTSNRTALGHREHRP